MFIGDFEYDLETILYAVDDGVPFGFARYADGERIISCGGYKDMDGWEYPGGSGLLSMDLRIGMMYRDPAYFIGISCKCCAPEDNEWYLQRVLSANDHITFSNIFANNNHKRFKEYLGKNIRDFDILSSKPEATIQFPVNAIHPYPRLDEYLDSMENSEKDVILLSAGPVSGILIMRYIDEGRKPKTLLDVGSALDPYFGRKSRGYTKGWPTAHKICRSVW